MRFFKPTWAKVLTAMILILAVVVAEVYLLGSRNNQPISQFHTPSQAPTVIQTSSAHIQPSPSPFPTSSGQTNIIPGWKTYTSHTVGYSIQVPSGWFVQQFEDYPNPVFSHQDYNTNMSLQPKPQIGPDDPDGAGIDILFPITIQGPHKDTLSRQYEQGLQGLEHLSPSDPSSLKDNFYTEIQGRRALITKSISAVKPPSYVHGASWCSECTEKNVYLDLGNGSILTISGFWQKGAVGFEKIFDEITSTLKFTN